MKKREPPRSPEQAEQRRVRSGHIRNRDADLLEASLGKLPTPSKPPAVVVMVGLPGSGKSHLARLIATRVGAVQLDSDALRKALYKEPRHTEQEHRRLFPALHVLMERLLERGLTVIVDATNLKEANRKPYYRIAAKYGAPVFLVRTWAPSAVIRQRLADRESERPAHDYSTATLEVYQKMRLDAERVRKRHVSVDTSRDVKAAVDRIVSLLQS
ncbi:MAG: ATP-binding protein [Chloroflexota bacterium]